MVHSDCDMCDLARLATAASQEKGYMNSSGGGGGDGSGREGWSDSTSS